MTRRFCGHDFLGKKTAMARTALRDSYRVRTSTSKDMNRKLEKNLIRIGAIWNIITGAITLFYYSSWMEQNILVESANNPAGLLVERYYNESVHLFVMIYGMIFILIGAINFYLSTKVENKISYKIPIWLCIWTLLSFFTVDITGFTLYMAAFVMYLLKNKAFKAINE